MEICVLPTTLSQFGWQADTMSPTVAHHKCSTNIPLEGNTMSLKDRKKMFEAKKAAEAKANATVEASSNSATPKPPEEGEKTMKKSSLFSRRKKVTVAVQKVTNIKPEVKPEEVMQAQTLSSILGGHIIMQDEYEPMDAMVIAQALALNVDWLGTDSLFEDYYYSSVNNVKLVVYDVEEQPDTSSLGYSSVGRAMTDLKTVGLVEVDEEGLYQPTAKLTKVMGSVKQKYAPTILGDKIKRKHSKTMKGASKLSRQLIESSEAAPFNAEHGTVEEMTEAFKIIKKTDKDHKILKQEYMLEGARKMIKGTNYVSEYHFDDRYRAYQSACHGPVGAGSDLGRGIYMMMNVDMGYDVKDAFDLLIEALYENSAFKEYEEDDMMDMAEAAYNGGAKWLAKQILSKKSKVKKPVCFYRYTEGLWFYHRSLC